LSNIVIAVLAIALFIFGILCFGFAFQVPEAWRYLTFLGGILSCTAALFVPMTFIGRSNRSW
jgi:ABC-type transport system involved in multi-copper enzyme maturation permease subunit